jgi:hypothetical protein
MSGKMMCIRQAHAFNSGALAKLRVEYTEKTKEITGAWKEGFAALKAANDAAQAARDEWRASERERIANELRTDLAACDSESG